MIPYGNRNHPCSRWISCLLIKELVCFSVIHLNKHLLLMARTLQLLSSPAPFIAKLLSLLSLLIVFSSHSLLHFPFLGHHLATPVKHLSCRTPVLSTRPGPRLHLTCYLSSISNYSLFLGNLHDEIMMELIFLHLCKMSVDTSCSLFCGND